jgi:hypothetical protein
MRQQRLLHFEPQPNLAERQVQVQRLSDVFNDGYAASGTDSDCSQRSPHHDAHWIEEPMLNNVAWRRGNDYERKEKNERSLHHPYDPTRIEPATLVYNSI